MNIKINIDGDRALLTTPYNADFVTKVKGIGGAKWNGAVKAWSIPADAVDVAREIMRSVYGQDDNPISGGRMLRLRITVNDDLREHCGDVTLYGKCLAHATGRDSGARCGDGVAYIAGGPESGGSAKNWRSTVPAGSVVALSDVPEAIYNATDAPIGCTVEIMEDEKPNLKALEEEKERLLARIREIDATLAALCGEDVHTA